MTELASALGVHKSTASRLAATLAARGFLERAAQRVRSGSGPSSAGSRCSRHAAATTSRSWRDPRWRGSPGTRGDGQPRAARGLRGRQRRTGRWQAHRRRRSWTGQAHGSALHRERQGLLAFSGRTLPGGELEAFTARTITSRERARAGGSGRCGRVATRPPWESSRKASTPSPCRSATEPVAAWRAQRLRAVLPDGPTTLDAWPSAAARGGRGDRVAPGTERACGLSSRPTCSTSSTSTCLRGARFDDPRSPRSTSTSSGPATPCRLTHVLDAVEPRVKARLRSRPSPARSARCAGRPGPDEPDRGAAVVACADFPAEERPLHEQEGSDRHGRARRRALAAGADDERRADLSSGRGRRQRGLRGGVRETKLRARAISRPRRSARSRRGGDSSSTSSAAQRRRSARGRALLLSSPRSGRSTRSTSTGADPRRLPAVAAESARGPRRALTCGEYHWAGLRTRLPLPELGARPRAARGRR